ncbi:uncharacterized protein LOC144177697 isoform X1 [Haemaphysalis longicornis]
MESGALTATSVQCEVLIRNSDGFNQPSFIHRSSTEVAARNNCQRMQGGEFLGRRTFWQKCDPASIPSTDSAPQTLIRILGPSLVIRPIFEAEAEGGNLSIRTLKPVATTLGAHHADFADAHHGCLPSEAALPPADRRRSCLDVATTEVSADHHHSAI